MNRRTFFRRSAALGTAGVLANPAAAPAADTIDRVAILSVGVNVFKSPNVSRLSGCVNDARDVEARFRVTAARFGVPEAAVWARPLADEKATRRAITDGLDALVRECGPGTLAVIFLSGHGGRRGGDWRYLPHDYDPADRTTGVSAGELLAPARAAAARGATVLIVLDACYAGEVRNAADDVLEEFKEGRPGGVVLFASSIPGQVSLDRGTNSLFTDVFLEALAGAADVNSDGKITLKEVRRYVSWRGRHVLRTDARLPGLKWSEQDFVCDYSPSVSESLVLSAAKWERPAPGAGSPFVAGPRNLPPRAPADYRATPFRPWMPLAAAGTPRRATPGLLRSAGLMGSWKWERPLLNRDGKTVTGADGKPLAEVYVLTFHKPAANGSGTYQVYHADGFGGRESGDGRYSFRDHTYGGDAARDLGFTDKVLALESENETDLVGLLDGAGPDAITIAPSVVDYFVWVRAKEMIARPELRRDHTGSVVLGPPPKIEVRPRGTPDLSGRAVHTDFLERTRGYVVVEPHRITLQRVK